jgi:hypothetical protein
VPTVLTVVTTVVPASTVPAMTTRSRTGGTRVVWYAVPACVAVLTLALTGAVYVLFGRGIDDAGDRTCDTFVSSGYTKATETADRVAIADEVNRKAQKSDSGRLAESGRALVPAATGTTEEWLAATQAMDRACSDAGWVPDL